LLLAPDQIRQLASAQVNVSGNLTRRRCQVEQIDGRPKVLKSTGQDFFSGITVHHEDRT
jgi:hypothetical protein